ncbi:MAG TPA: GyrI-like domain-containing protein, partial [Chitinispirillaceae bacterium]|nr:GyrI-like domain-containing protein [Chitinispirillaceae bacterium]
FIIPRSYRLVGVKTGIVEKMDIGNTVNPCAGKEISEPTVLSLPTRYFIGLKYSGTNNHFDTFSLTYAFLRRKSEIKNCTGENDYAFDTYHSDRYGNRIYDFYYTTPVISLRDVPKGMIGVEIPPTDYAIITYKGNSANLYSGDGTESVYTYIYKTLLPRHGLHFRDGEYKLQSDNSYQAVESDFTKIIIPVSI